MDRLIQMGKDLGYEGEKLQDFVKQQQDYERGERIAERELEKDKIAAHDKETEIERARIATEEATADKDMELERDRIAAQEKERADKLATQEKEREIELARIATQEKDSEIELARIAAEESKIAANERLEMARIEGIAEPFLCFISILVFRPEGQIWNPVLVRRDTMNYVRRILNASRINKNQLNSSTISQS